MLYDVDYVVRDMRIANMEQLRSLSKTCQTSITGYFASVGAIKFIIRAIYYGSPHKTGVGPISNQHQPSYIPSTAPSIML